MKYLSNPLARRFLKDQHGQSALLVTVMLFVVMGLSATGVETGHVFYAYRLLQASTKAAALAGAQFMPNLTVASANVTKYSSMANQENATILLQNASLTTNYYCSAAAKGIGVACATPSAGSCSTGSTCNALTVTQRAQTHLWFGGLLGLPAMNLTYSATASMRGGADTPFNIAVIMDTTASMASCTSSHGVNQCTVDCPNGATSQIACAVQGLQVMLQAMDPCFQNTTCTASTPYVDDVALFTFPALANTAANIAKDTTCPSSNPKIVPYAFTNVTPGSMQNLNMPLDSALYPTNAGTYWVVPFEDTYKANDGSATPLSSADALAIAAGAGGGRCEGLQAPGGEATYYAQAIKAAQAALVTQQSNNSNSVNIMIILSDGDATSCNTGGNTAAGACNSADQVVALNCPAVTSATKNGKTTVTCGASSQTPCPSTAAAAKYGGCTTAGSAPLNGTGTATTNPTGYISPTYPSVLGMCGQAVQAAQAATAAGTTVITVAMGSPTSGSCTSDRTYSITSGATYGVEGYTAGQQACQAIGAMASSPDYAYKSSATFYSDATNGCEAAGGNVSYTTMAEIFKAIATSFQSARLIPSGT